MLFTAPLFLFLFLPAFLALHTLAPARYRMAILLGASLVFYGWWQLSFLPVLLGVIGWSWACALYVARPHRKARLAVAVGGLIALLGGFKYAHTGIDGFFAVFAPAAGRAPEWITGAAMPVGLSFFVFHAISYIIDVSRGDAPVARRPMTLAAFIAMFPHLVAGPVLRYKDLAPQMIARTTGAGLFAEGCLRFMAGFSKKILIADPVATLADAAFALESPALGDAWLGVIAYAVQIYFDFSGYSDMANGLALMLGLRFAENFNAPYHSHSLSEFWRRWHISLSAWLRDYVYIPLGGSRRGMARTCLNLFATLTLAGIWHGAGVTFLLWGMWHGALLALERATGFSPRGAGGRLYCLMAVAVGWVLFRAPDIATALSVWAGLSGGHGAGVSAGISAAMAVQIKVLSLIALAAGLGLAVVEPRLSAWRSVITLPGGGTAGRTALPASAQAVTVALFALALSRLLAEGQTPFLYGQF